ncbi:radical SAM family heme chaperone HemW [Chlamydia caviae]|uniref:Heme chaperone HemW n=1 Tax=Chlamydia caviae (strain ATCC VR-813 / DSM 19441 / 03DC25 / GPIC) TaxID=227941 RepID=Q823J2_CHLCV|nr:radical SAM family heme chaperone HemW [Chlamydia caviae]AAP05164.1 oxygen-independent coproporphyrinogen III oxidase HemN, putative [Chlamydia caviae GPIC]
MNGKQPLALYIHFPFCSKKCHYCSFYTIPYNPESVSLYCNAVLQEGLNKLAAIKDTHFIDTVFFGGGTPSLIPPHHLHNIITLLAPHAQEITLEANPEDLSESYLRDLTLTPINRISIGVQTFHDPILKALGRIHSASTSMDAVHRCYEHEFHNISIDLIYGLPTQSLADFLADLHQALTLPIAHISLYNLTLDPHTSFYKHRRILTPSIANDDILAAMSLSAEELLSSRGFSRYELASYAKSQAQSKHNLYYWTDKPFLGLGVSASQYIDKVRSKNLSRISQYLRAVRKNLPTHESTECLPEKERIKEALALRLRLTKGAKIKDFPPSLIQSLTSLPLIKELFDHNDEFLFLNKQGRLFHDTIAEEIMNLSFLI